MNAKKFTLLFISFFMLTYALLYLLYYLVNPEQIFSNSITEKKFVYTKEYSRKQFKELENKKHSLIFGTSQIHSISSKMMGQNILNFHNIYGEPGDILNFLQQLDGQQINNIDKIMYIIDLRAGATRIDKGLINYHERKIEYPVLTTGKLSRLFQDIINNNTLLSGYLNKDGSIEHLNPKKHIINLPAYPYTASLEYDDNLIEGILKVNKFALKHHKKIIFFTPVTNEKYFKTIDFTELSHFFTALLNGGIDKIKIFFYIPGLSDAKNDKLEYISFMDPEHLNQYFVQQWLKQYVLTNNEFVVSDQATLDTYLKDMKTIQSNP